MITKTQLGKLAWKFKNIKVLPVSMVAGVTANNNPSTELVDVFCIKYQKHGAIPGRMSEGLIEANAMWDTRKSRPPGYFAAKSIEKPDGYCVSIMVADDWLEFNSIEDHIEGWNEL